MAYCRNCGKEIDDNADVCIYCGFFVREVKKVDPNAKSKLAAGLLAFFVGTLGIHNFYLGNTQRGVIQLLITIVGGFLIVGPLITMVWSIVEGVQILTGTIHTDAAGIELKD